MTEGREPTLVVEGRLDERLAERAFAAAEAAHPEERISSALEAAIDLAESDPQGAREALWALRGSPVALKRLEVCLGMGPERATLALGAAIQIASVELGSCDPDLRGRSEEILRWLEGAW
jgi:hypothetical protein